MADFWTEAKVEELRELWSQGLPASKIAVMIGAISRNAIIGKSRRIGLASRGPAVNKKGKMRRRDYTPEELERMVERREAAAKKALERLEEIRAIGEAMEAERLKHPVAKGNRNGVTLMELDSVISKQMCRWPMWEDKTVGDCYCGKQVARGAYCEAHAKIAYGGVPKMKARAPHAKAIEIRILDEEAA